MIDSSRTSTPPRRLTTSRPGRGNLFSLEINYPTLLARYHSPSLEHLGRRHYSLLSYLNAGQLVRGPGFPGGAPFIASLKELDVFHVGMGESGAFRLSLSLSRDVL